MTLPANPFQTLRDVQLGRIEVHEASKMLNLSNRAVMVRLTKWGEHLALFAWAYPMLQDTSPPNLTARSELLEQISAKIGKSRRQTVRMMTEYAAFATLEGCQERKLGSLRRLHHLFNLEFLAAKVLAGNASIPDLMTTSESDGVCRSALYRALNKMAAKHHLTVREAAKLEGPARDRLAEQVSRYIQKRQDQLIREQIARDKAAAERFRGRRGSPPVRSRGSAQMHA